MPNEGVYSVSFITMSEIEDKLQQALTPKVPFCEDLERMRMAAMAETRRLIGEVMEIVQTYTR